MKLKEVRIYLALLALPYLSLVCDNVNTLFISILLLLLLGIFDVLFAKGNIVWKHIYLIIFISLFVFLYSLMIKESIEYLYNKYDLYSLNVHLRHIYLVIIPVIIVVYYNRNHKIIYSIYAVFTIALSLALLITTYFNTFSSPKSEPLVWNNVFDQLESKNNRKTICRRKNLVRFFSAGRRPGRRSRSDCERGNQVFPGHS